MRKISKNKKLNYVLNYIYEELEEMDQAEVKRYIESFPNQVDHNLAEYGNLLIYHYDIRDLYCTKAGYKSLQKISDTKLWEIYKQQVGYIARNYFNN